MYSGVICTQCHIVLEADAGHAGFNELGRGGERVLHDDIARLDTGVTRNEKGVQIRCEMLRGGGEESGLGRHAGPGSIKTTFSQ